MWSLLRTSGAVALALGTLPVPAVAQADALPKGRAVIQRFIDAVGGEAALKRQAGRHVVGTFDVPAQGISGDLELYQAPPDRMAVTVTIPGIGTVRTGYNGTVAWNLNPMLGPRVLDGLERAQLAQEADFESGLYPERLFTALETEAEEEFDGVPCYRVKVTTVDGESYVEFFDKSTGLQRGSRRTQGSPMGDIEAVSVVSDWRDVGGVKIPFKSVQRAMGIEQVVTIATVETMAVPDSVFAVPAEIQALTGQQ
ncbi:MAG: DUF4412 domain-containing protein [Gemmatimonadota bacterium]|nr:DUF4412 domain-containing protein [Gemmatimonadota bacterium]